MEESELYICNSLDRVFLIELAQRKSLKENPETMKELFNLRREIEKTSSKHKGKDKYFGEGSYEHDDDQITDFVFDVLQFPCPQERAKNEKYRRFLAVLARAYRARVNAVIVDLPYLKGFTLADFSCRNDVLELRHSWFLICDEQTRKECNLVGKYGNVSPLSKGANGTAFSAISLLHRLPTTVFHPCFQNVFFDLFRLNLESGLYFLIVQNYCAKDLSEWDIGMMISVEVADGGYANGKPYKYDIVDELFFSHQYRRSLVKNSSSINYLLNGLICWDIKNEPKLVKKISVDEMLIRANKTISGIFSTGGFDQNTLKDNYNRVSKLVNSYTPEFLPWL